MSDFAINVGALKRYFPSDTPVLVVGHHPRKAGRVKAAFVTFNFSFILNGEGDYCTAERTYDVQAPCVITQWPGVPVEYGPKRTWEEVFLMFDANVLPALLQRGLARREKPVWYIRDIDPVRRHNNDLRDALRDVAAYGRADEIDRIVEAMVLASWVGERPSLNDPHERQIEAIRTYIDAHLQEEFDFDELGLEHGFSPRGFRRYWEKFIGPPPLRYVTEARVRQACRMLVETRQPVQAIATAVGFDDALYFSRVFRRVMKTAPTQYREQRQSGLTFLSPE